MRDWKYLLVVLLASSIAVYETFAGAIADKRREKRWYDKDCEEKVIERSPTCKKIICDENRPGERQELVYECPIIPKECPKKVTDDKAECCPEKCVCGDGETMYAPGEKFHVVRGGRHLECECGKDAVPSCREVYIVPPKRPPRPPPVPPSGLFPPEQVPQKRDWPWN